MRHPFLILPLFAAGLSHAATFHVATDGDDAKLGTEEQPWKSLQKASSSVAAGDTVRIKAGEYFVKDGWKIRRAGTADKPITYQGYGGEVRITSATLVPADSWKHVKDATYSTDAGPAALAVFRDDLPMHSPSRAKIESAEALIPNSFYKSGKTLYVRLEDGSHPKDSKMRVAPGHTISLYDCHHSVFEGLTVEFGFNGFKDQGDTTHHITIRKCVIRSIASQGIQPVAAHCVIEHNLFQKIGANKYEHAIYGSEPGTIIRHNVFEEMAGAGIHQYNQNKPAGGNCEFYGNVFRKPRKMTLPASSSSKNFYYTDIIAWGQGNNLIYNNVFYGEGKRSGISLNSPGNRVFHNTFVGSTAALDFHAGKPGNQVVNNIFQDAARSFVIWPAEALPQTLDYNIYHNAKSPLRWQRDGVAFQDFSAWQKAAGEAHSLCVDPVLSGKDDGRPKAGSPAINAGKAVNEVAADFDGVVRPQGAGSDIGAYEHKAE